MVGTLRFAHPTAAPTPSHSRRALRPRFARKFPPSANKGREECRAPDAPAVSCAIIVVDAHTSIQVTPESPGTPRAMVYSLSRALLGAPGFLATVAPEKLSLPRNLTPASGCQNLTILLSASGALVRRTFRVHRSPPRERDDRDSPLLVGRDGERYRPDLP